MRAQAQSTLPLIPTTARPFLKWAGGKTQLIDQISRYFPRALLNGAIRRYAEPFVGSGAVFFHVAQNFQVSRFFLSDINPELVLAYVTVRDAVEALISTLAGMQQDYYAMDPDEQQEHFYQVRHEFNQDRATIDFKRFDKKWVRRTAQLIFLNRTCFNGLFRVNARGAFNVPFGRYKKPLICARDNLRAVSHLLHRAEIVHGDFTLCETFVTADTFVYFDPPYRPISATSSFTSYSMHDFGEAEQIRLASFYRHLDGKRAKLMLSNSDARNGNPDDDFFEELYHGFRIERVLANRMINCDASKRGKIHELLVMNFEG
jgi:DNA adenine methylase